MKKPTHSSAENEELNDAPLLRSIQSTDPYKAPEGYFDALSSDIQHKISRSQSHKTSSVKIWKPVFAVVGVLIVALLIGYFKKDTGNAEKIQVAVLEEQISCDDLLDSNYYLEIDEYLISEAMNNSHAASITNDSLSDIEIENYLIQSADELLLTNEL